VTGTEAAPGGPVVLITGATGGLGRVVARAFASDGARLVLVGRDQARLDILGAELAAALRSMPDVDAVAAVAGWTKVVGDLRDAEAARAVAAAAEARYGRIDVLLHLIGGWSGGTPVVDIDHDEIRTMLDQHLWTTLNIVQAVAPGMIARRSGRVAAVSSPVATVPPARSAGYSIAKAAEEVLLRSLAREAAADGVTANVVVVRGITEVADPPAEPAPRKAGWATPGEIAQALAFLASPAGASVNGIRLELNAAG
jgi:NAD(P)-dependent dehydrogenase (short-subunit alcohol dehydrogenase family)